MDRNSRPLSDQIGGSLNPEFVEWLMGWPKNWTLTYSYSKQAKCENATSKNTATRKDLRELREGHGEETVCGPFRGCCGLQAAQVLQPQVYGYGDDQREPAEVFTTQEGAKAQAETVQHLRDGSATSDSSHGREQKEQRPIEPEDIMRVMSYEGTLADWESVVEETLGLQSVWGACAEIGLLSKALPTLQEVWRSATDEEKHWIAVRISSGSTWGLEWPGVPRLATGVKNRVGQLKALGNGQVPMQAALAWRILSDAISR